MSAGGGCLHGSVVFRSCVVRPVSLCRSLTCIDGLKSRLIPPVTLPRLVWHHCFRGFDGSIYTGHTYLYVSSISSGLHRWCHFAFPVVVAVVKVMGCQRCLRSGGCICVTFYPIAGCESGTGYGSACFPFCVDLGWRAFIMAGE